MGIKTMTTMNKITLDNLKLELSLKAKNGVDFIIAAAVIWMAIAIIWTLSTSDYTKSVFTLMIGGAMLPLALLMSKILRTNWKLKENPLQPLGLWLNFAQLFYFPFLVLVMIKFPEYFVLTYAIITGAHFFPYAWFYNERGYAVMAGIISFGSLAIGLTTSVGHMYYVPTFVCGSLLVLCGLIGFSYRRKQRVQTGVDIAQMPT
jgi:hypothetical protein